MASLAAIRTRRKVLLKALGTMPFGAEHDHIEEAVKELDGIINGIELNLFREQVNAIFGDMMHGRMIDIARDKGLSVADLRDKFRQLADAPLGDE